MKNDKKEKALYDQNSTHKFRISDAIKMKSARNADLCAVLLFHIRNRCRYSKTEQRNIREYNGKKYYWYHETLRNLAKLYPYSSKNGISRAVQSLEEKGLIISAPLNQEGFISKSRKWYTIPFEFEYIDGNFKDIEITNENTKEVSFRVLEAKNYGISKAVILYYLTLQFADWNENGIYENGYNEEMMILRRRIVKKMPFYSKKSFKNWIEWMKENRILKEDDEYSDQKYIYGFTNNWMEENPLNEDKNYLTEK